MSWSRAGKNRQLAVGAQRYKAAAVVWSIA